MKVWSALVVASVVAWGAGTAGLVFGAQDVAIPRSAAPPPAPPPAPGPPPAPAADSAAAQGATPNPCDEGRAGRARGEGRPGGPRAGGAGRGRDGGGGRGRDGGSGRGRD